MARKTFLKLEDKFYQPELAEQGISDLWNQSGAFRGQVDSKKPVFSVVIPPPNVTGRLHMGHALNNSVQDALCRFKRMDGYDVCWLPGTDHAGISTQSVVKKQLDAEGINYLELGRDKTIERIWEWKNKYGDYILKQLGRIGCSCDFSRTRFTMDEGLSRAVVVAFKKLYDDGLIYRGKYIVNWCPVDRTALSDDEVNTVEGGEPGSLWYLRYPLSDGSGHVTIATTRPETMLGDSAIAVNPKDERYRQLIGKTAILPLVGRELPIIADDFVDQELGTGCLKVTPAHDPWDFQIGQRHNLPQISVMNSDATIGEEAPPEFHGIDRFECRKLIVSKLKELGLIEKIEERMTPVGRAERSKAIIEYRLSDQWFVKMKPLATHALTLAKKQGLEFIPDRFEGIFNYWLENTRDWCISRQIWWGHRIPAWYHRETGEILVDVETPARVAAEPTMWRQEEDVLDTWFSSALWPFSTFGWPESTAELSRYYPTSILSTAKDIIYFWVARMVMVGSYLLNEIPFKRVYFHPVVGLADGETMSKSKGNGIDPMTVISGASVEDLIQPALEARPSNMEEIISRIRKVYPNGFPGLGADALRLTLLSQNSYAQQIPISLERFEEEGKRFLTKLWNASKLIFMHFAPVESGSDLSASQLEDRWILFQLDGAISKVRVAMEEVRISEALGELSRFFWNDICDWYLELIKPRMREGDSGDRLRVQLTLAQVYAGLLKLYHPFLPFVTEELWGHLQHQLTANSWLKNNTKLCTKELLCEEEMPNISGAAHDQSISEFCVLQEIVIKIRGVIAESGAPKEAKPSVYLLPLQDSVRTLLSRELSIIRRAARLESIELVSERKERLPTGVLDCAEIFVDLAGTIDVEAELGRNELALKKTLKEIESLEARLGNADFMARAPEDVRVKTAAALDDARGRAARITKIIADLRCN